MSDDIEKAEREERAERLRRARVRAQRGGPTAVAEALKMSLNTYKAYEQGRNGYSVTTARQFADFFGVSLAWLYLGLGSIEETDLPGASSDLRRVFARAVDAPQMVQEQIISFAEFQLSRASQSREMTTNPTS